ncbi:MULTISPECIES: response regulator [unclassified Motilimonas]|uniref:response regulator n=1 Tax=Motilimonas TaxID=1914248 RepID=UPI001E60492C|nr:MULTISPECIES: response regulator [unclassified Motilimonas]MCE0558259.1 winged helix-turn-helix domain-containing protein [Motilimonas sp. E26]MDO6525326.1 winged helix-turn-helix domain-containing protein [Motilimonas sp. 1_MG-2023]
MKILLVEDAPILRHHLKTQLEAIGNHVYDAENAEMGDYYANQYPIDVAIVDLGLPDMDGLDLVKKFREQGLSFPILILTARGNWQEKVIGLESGADDYVVKPFQQDELWARLNALVRRSAGFIKPQIEAGPYRLDLAKKSLTVAEQEVELTAFEYQILEYLMRNHGQVVSKQQLLDQLYSDSEGDPNVVEVMVSRLRKKMDKDNTIKPINTIRGQGYLFSISCK